MLTRERLQELLTYDPETGVFAWRRISRSNSEPIRKGAVAGSVDHHHGSYRRLKIDGCRYAAARVVWLWMTGHWPTLQVDHINLDSLDNRWSNLREATPSQNKANSRAPASNTSGFKGVCWQKNQRRWQARARVGGRRVYLGLYDTPGAAHAAYACVTEASFGAFARMT